MAVVLCCVRILPRKKPRRKDFLFHVAGYIFLLRIGLLLFELLTITIEPQP